MRRREFLLGASGLLLSDVAFAQMVPNGGGIIAATPNPPAGFTACAQACVPSGQFVDSTNNSLNSRLHCVAPPGGLANIVLAWPGFGVNNPEFILPTGFTAQCSIEYPAGTFTRVTWGGANSVAVFPGEKLFFSDQLSIAIPGGAAFYVKSFITWSAGNFWLSQEVASTLTDEWTNRGSGLTDQTLTSTTLSCTDGNGYAPSIYTNGLTKAVGGIGDSIMYSPDTPSPIDATRGYAAAMRQAIPFINLGRNGDAFSFYVPNPLGRRAMLRQRVSSLICEYGTNDTFLGSMTLALLQTNAQFAWAEYLNDGIKVWQTTLTPRTTSTDNWATTANQTIVSSTAETMRIGFNSWLRSNYQSLGLAGIIDVARAVDATDTGKWGVDGVTGSNAAGFCTLTGGVVTACNLASYVNSGSSAGSGYPTSQTISCVVYGMPGEIGNLPTITANTDGSGKVTGFNIVSGGSNLLYPPMVAPQGQWTQDGTHPAHRGYNEIIKVTGLSPTMFQ